MGWVLIQWWGRAWLIAEDAHEGWAGGRLNPGRRGGSWAGTVVAGAVTVGLLFLAWIPILGLCRVAMPSGGG